MAKPCITASEALEWEALLGRHRPQQPKPSDAQGAAPVVSFNVLGSSHGVLLRVRTDKGQADLFLNAAVAIQIADVIRQVGDAARWMNDDDGSLIVTDPQNLHHSGRKT